MNPTPPPPPPAPILLPAYNMKALLIVLGVVSCLIGAVYLIMAIVYLAVGEIMLNSAPALMAEAIAEIQHPTTPASPQEEMTPEDKAQFVQFLHTAETWLPYGHGLIITGVLSSILYGVAFGWVGIGSIQARKWARKVAVSLGWLHIGYIAICIVVVLGAYPTLVRLLEVANELIKTIPTGSAVVTPPVPPPMPTINPHAHAAFFTAQYVMSFAFSSVGGVILVVLYGLRNVKLTCEHFDPKPRWTDRLAMPVLIAVVYHIWVAATALTMLPMAPMAYIVFGKGAPLNVALILLLSGVLAAFTARFMTKLNPLGWILAIVGTVLQGVVWIGGTQALGNVGLKDVGPRLNVPSEEWSKVLNEVPPAVVRISDILTQTWLPQALVIACLLGYLVWIRPHFFQAGKETLLRQRPIPS